MTEAVVEQVVVTDASIDPNKFILTGIDTSREPHFSVSEVAKFFFARSAHWVRWLERKGCFVLDGEPVGDRRTEQGARYYTLTDVEQMAHALAQQSAITGSQLRTTLLLVENQARLWGYI